MPLETHLFDANVDVAVRDRVLSEAVDIHRAHPCKHAMMWWPAFLWIQFGSTTTNGSELTPFVPDTRLRGLLHNPLPLSAVIDVISWFVLPHQPSALLLSPQFPFYTFTLTKKSFCDY
jgi:hypothetical protein